MDLSPAAHPIAPAGAMASAWRRRPVCLLIGEAAAPAALLAINAREAIVATTLHARAGTSVALRHPEAGEIPAAVVAGDAALLRLSFAGDARAVAFALAAIAADMSRAA